MPLTRDCVEAYRLRSSLARRWLRDGRDSEEMVSKKFEGPTSKSTLLRDTLYRQPMKKNEKIRSLQEKNGLFKGHSIIFAGMEPTSQKATSLILYSHFLLFAALYFAVPHLHSDFSRMNHLSLCVLMFTVFVLL